MKNLTSSPPGRLYAGSKALSLGHRLVDLGIKNGAELTGAVVNIQVISSLEAGKNHHLKSESEFFFCRFPTKVTFLKKKNTYKKKPLDFFVFSLKRQNCPPNSRKALWTGDAWPLTCCSEAGDGAFLATQRDGKVSIPLVSFT